MTEAALEAELNALQTQIDAQGVVSQSLFAEATAAKENGDDAALAELEVQLAAVMQEMGGLQEIYNGKSMELCNLRNA